jgi:hypothetical protein
MSCGEPGEFSRSAAKVEDAVDRTGSSEPVEVPKGAGPPEEVVAQRGHVVEPLVALGDVREHPTYVAFERRERTVGKR